MLIELLPKLEFRPLSDDEDQDGLNVGAPTDLDDDDDEEDDDDSALPDPVVDDEVAPEE
jgi:hypothetical protein